MASGRDGRSQGVRSRLADTRRKGPGGRGHVVRSEPRRARRGAHERRGGVREVRDGGSAEQGRAAGGVPGGEWAPFKLSQPRGIHHPSDPSTSSPPPNRPPTHLLRVPLRRRNTRVDPPRDGSRTSPRRRTRTTASTSSSATPGRASSLTSPTEAPPSTILPLAHRMSSPGWTETAKVRGARRGSCTDSATRA